MDIPKGKTHLIFDFDETLFHLILPWDKVHEGIKDQLIALDKSIYLDYKNHKINLPQLENAYISKFGQKAKDLIIKSRREFESRYLRDVVPNSGLVDFVKAAKGYQIYIWSSNTREVVESILKKFAIWNKFTKIITRDDVNLLKPDPEGFSKIYDPKIPKEKYLFIGNSHYDRQAAQKSGIDFYLIDYFK